jgi:uncharacterized membrane protein
LKIKNGYNQLMKRALLLIAMSLSLQGMADATYITWEKIRGLFPVCNAAFKCAEVLSSKWASIGPVPVSALGMFFYLTVFVVALLLYVDVTQLRCGRRILSLSKIFLGQGVLGLGFSAYLVSVMGLILHAWCLYCLLSAINCVCLLIVTGIVFKLSKRSFYES